MNPFVKVYLQREKEKQQPFWKHDCEDCRIARNALNVRTSELTWESLKRVVKNGQCEEALATQVHLIAEVVKLFEATDFPVQVEKGIIPKLEREEQFNKIMIAEPRGPIFSHFRTKLIDFVSLHGLMHVNFPIYLAPFGLFFSLEVKGTHKAYEIRVLHEEKLVIYKAIIKEDRERNPRNEAQSFVSSYGSTLEIDTGASSVVRMLGMKEETPPYKIAEQLAVEGLINKAENQHRVPYKMMEDEGPKIVPGTYVFTKTSSFQTEVEGVPEGVKVLDSPTTTVIVATDTLKKPVAFKMGTSSLKKIVRLIPISARQSLVYRVEGDSKAIISTDVSATSEQASGVLTIRSCLESTLINMRHYSRIFPARVAFDSTSFYRFVVHFTQNRRRMYEIVAAVDHMFLTRPRSLRAYLQAIGVERLDTQGKIYWQSPPYLEAREFFVTRRRMRGDFFDVDANWLWIRTSQEVGIYFHNLLQELPSLLKQISQLSVAFYSPGLLVKAFDINPESEILVMVLLREIGRLVKDDGFERFIFDQQQSTASLNSVAESGSLELLAKALVGGETTN